MKERDPAIIRAEELRTVIETPEYKRTLGRWIEEARKHAEHDLDEATELTDIYRAQGRKAAVKEIIELIDKVFIDEEAQYAKMDRRVKEKK